MHAARGESKEAAHCGRQRFRAGISIHHVFDTISETKRPIGLPFSVSYPGLP